MTIDSTEQYHVDGDLREILNRREPTASIDDLKKLGYTERKDTQGLLNDSGTLLVVLVKGVWLTVGVD